MRGCRNCDAPVCPQVCHRLRICTSFGVFARCFCAAPSSYNLRVDQPVALLQMSALPQETTVRAYFYIPVGWVHVVFDSFFECHALHGVQRMSVLGSLYFCSVCGDQSTKLFSHRQNPGHQMVEVFCGSLCILNCLA